MKVDLGKCWNNILVSELKQEYFLKLIDEVEKRYATVQCLPSKDKVFKAFLSCPFNDVKVVILGQDPYPTPGHANGMCFSVSPDVKPLPKSLLNIFKCIKNDLGIDIPDNGSLERWTDQGVFLLNTILTVEAGHANSHSKIGWQNFTDEVIRKVSQNKDNVVFMLWGSQAHKKEVLIDREKHHVLKSVHPSPLSAYRGFMDCKHFSKANAYLEKRGGQAIDW